MAYGTNAPFGLRALYSLNGGTWVEQLTTCLIPANYARSIFTGDLVILSKSKATVNTIDLYLPEVTNGGGRTTFDQTDLVYGVFQGCEYVDATTKVPTFSKWYPANTVIVPGTEIKAFVNFDTSLVWEVQISTFINAVGGSFAGGNTPAGAGPFFPGVAGAAAFTAGFGSNFSIMGGGGNNFNTIQIDATRPQLGFYTNNPTSTATFPGNEQTITAARWGSNPFGGNTLSGISGAYLCVSTYGANATNLFEGDGAFTATKDYVHTTATLPLKVIGYSPNSQNLPLPGKTLATTPFVNLAVMINNHVFKPGTSGQTFGA